MKKEELKQKGVEFLCDYDKKIMSPSHSITDFVEMLTDYVYYLTQRGIIRDKEEPIPKKESYLLFGSEVCQAIADAGSCMSKEAENDDADPLQEVLDLIRDGAEYMLMKTDGSNLTAILGQLEEYGGYAFLNEEEYKKILNIEI